jgi:hypothetical protein
MANTVVFVGNNIGLRAVQLADNVSYALATKDVSAGTPMAAGDIAASIFGINYPIRLVRLSDGTYALATATAVTPKPAADRVAALFGNNISIRLVALGDGSYALATAAQ